MNARLVALDEGPDIHLDRAMVVVGRHPACDFRLDSLRVSRHHCCMMPDEDDLLVRDLGSTNGIRINGQRVEIGRLRMGDELSIAHIRYRLEAGRGRDGAGTQADPSSREVASRSREAVAVALDGGAETRGPEADDLAAVVRGALPPSMAHRCKIEVIVRMEDEDDSAGPPPPTPVGPSDSSRSVEEAE